MNIPILHYYVFDSQLDLLGTLDFDGEVQEFSAEAFCPLCDEWHTAPIKCHVDFEGDHFPE